MTDVLADGDSREGAIAAPGNSPGALIADLYRDHGVVLVRYALALVGDSSGDPGRPRHREGVKGRSVHRSRQRAFRREGQAIPSVWGVQATLDLGSGRAPGRRTPVLPLTVT
jgi:hypothetical protein